MSVIEEAKKNISSWMGELDAPVIELRVIEKLIKELEQYKAVVDAAREAKQALMLRSTVTQCHATQHEIGVLRRLTKALSNLKEKG